MADSEDLDFNPNQFSGSVEHNLAPEEIFALDPNTSELFSRGEALKRFGFDAEVVARIKASREKEFLLLNLTKTPIGIDGGHKLFPDDVGGYFADYLLIDDKFGPRATRSYKGIRKGEPPFTIGRNYYGDRFVYPDNVSRAHFEIGADKEGVLQIRNLKPTNSTIVYTKPHHESAPNKVENRSYTNFRGNAYEHSEQLRIALELGIATESLYGEDRHAVIREKGVLGIFDGAGGVEGGELAAEAARRAILEAGWVDSGHNIAALEDLQIVLQSIMDQANERVIKNAPEAITTATVAQIAKVKTPDGSVLPYLIWASAGDSRLYIHANGKVRQISTDEGVASTIYNCLGQSGNFRGRVKQFGAEKLSTGDTVILVTDGITGDVGADIMETDEILDSINRSNSAQDIANNLLEASRKRDDKTCIVARIG